MKSLVALFAFQVALLAAEPIRILPLGDSITRGSYLVKHEDGSTFALPHPENGGWRADSSQSCAPQASPSILLVLSTTARVRQMASILTTAA